MLLVLNDLDQKRLSTSVLLWFLLMNLRSKDMSDEGNFKRNGLIIAGTIIFLIVVTVFLAKFLA